MLGLSTDEVIYLGEYAGELIGSERFQQLVALFQRDAADRIISTKHDDKDERERIYHSIRANEEFGTLLHTLAKAAVVMLGERKPQQFSNDTPEQTTPSEVELSDEEVFGLIDRPWLPDEVEG